MTWLVQVVYILCDVGGGGVNISLFLGMLVFFMWVVDEWREWKDDLSVNVLTIFLFWRRE